MSKLIANTFPARPMSGGRFNPDMLIGHWLWQPKYNGWRAFIDLETNQVFNRHGNLMSIHRCSEQFVMFIGRLRCRSISWLRSGPRQAPFLHENGRPGLGYPLAHNE